MQEAKATSNNWKIFYTPKLRGKIEKEFHFLSFHDNRRHECILLKYVIAYTHNNDSKNLSKKWLIHQLVSNLKHNTPKNILAKELS